MRGLAKLLLIRNAVICFILPACLLCIASEASTAVFDKYEYDVGVLEEGKSLLFLNLEQSLHIPLKKALTQQ